MLGKFKSYFGKDGMRQQKEFQKWLDDAEKVLKGMSNIDISISVTDPSVHDNPFIGISHGFTTLTGYEAKDILGRNCRFLRESVPSHLKVQGVSDRDKVRKFKKACKEAALMENCSESGPQDCCSSQINCKKDGSLFWNIFLMHFFRIDGKAYVMSLQSEVASSSLLNLPSCFDSRLQGSLETALECLIRSEVGQDDEADANFSEEDKEAELKLVQAKPEKTLREFFQDLSEADIEAELQKRERHKDQEKVNSP